MLIKILVMVIILLIFLGDSTLINTAEGDRQVLIDFYEVNRVQLLLGSCSPSNSWHGVEVNVIGRVIRLDQSDTNLSGFLPESTGNLSKLKYFNNKQNDMSGPIPSSMSNRTAIESLLLSRQYAEDPRENPQRAHHLGKSDERGNNFSGEFF